MDVLEAIRTRRTIHKFRPDPVPRDVLAEALDAAVWAPNHKLTEPWEFHVVSGDAKAALARLRGRLKAQKHPEPGSAAARRAGELAEQELLTVPWAVVVTTLAGTHPVQDEEDFAATACAILNLQYALHARGVGTYWGTGPLCRSAETFSLLGIPGGRRIVGVVFVGYPADVPTVGRTPAAEKTRWLS